MKKFNFKYLLKLLFILIALSSLMTFISLAYSTTSFNKEIYQTQVLDIKLVFLNLFPIFIILGILTFLTNRLWLGFFISSLAFSILAIANKNKLYYRDEPVKATDLEIISESINMAGKYDLIITIPMILMILGLICLSYILKKKCVLKDFNPKLRITALAFVLIIALIFSSNFFDKELYATIGDQSLINQWNENEQFQIKGLTYPFFYSFKEFKDIELDYYDERKVKALLEEEEYMNIPDEKKVNFISIMLEAYNDFSTFEGVELEKDIYKNFHDIQNNSISGKLITNVFGGGTINTELSYLNSIYLHPKYNKNTNSNVWYFKEQGYKTEAMHPFLGNFYNRTNVYDRLGFDNFYNYDNYFKNISEDYLKDIDFFDYIIKGYEQSKKEKQDYFHFSVTYQNHGPYSDKKTDDNVILKKKENYDDETYNIINNYLKGIAETDQALKKLVDYFEEEDEPVVLVFFGDHNPWLGDNAKGFEMMGINIDLDTVEGFKNYYATPYVFWANDKAKELLGKDFKGQGPELSPMFLMAELFDYIEYPGNEYMSYLKKAKENINVYNYNFYKFKDKYLRELNSEQTKVLEELNMLQFYHSRNFNKREKKAD